VVCVLGGLFVSEVVGVLGLVFCFVGCGVRWLHGCGCLVGCGIWVFLWWGVLGLVGVSGVGVCGLVFIVGIWVVCGCSWVVGCVFLVWALVGVGFSSWGVFDGWGLGFRG